MTERRPPGRCGDVVLSWPAWTARTRQRGSHWWRGRRGGGTRDRGRVGAGGVLRLRHRPEQPRGREVGDRAAGDDRGDRRADGRRRRTGHGPRRRPRGSHCRRGPGRAGRVRPRPPGRPGQRHLRRRPLRPVGHPDVGARPGGWPADATDGRGHPHHHRPRHVAVAAPRRPRAAGRDDRRHGRGQRQLPGAGRLLLRPRQGEREPDRPQSHPTSSATGP